MYRKLIALPFALLLAACGREEPPKALECANPAVLQDIRGSIQETLTQQARSFAREDGRQFVDADKIIAAAYGLAFSLKHASETQEGGRTFCIADLNITVPSETLADAEANSPLLYGETSLADIVQQKTGGNVEFKDGVLTAAVRFLPAKDARTAFIDNTVGMAAQTLSAALLPYGVKSIVMIDGKAVTKEDAVRVLSGKAREEEPSKPTPEDILEHNAAAWAMRAYPKPQKARPNPKSCIPTTSSVPIPLPYHGAKWKRRAYKTNVRNPKLPNFGEDSIPTCKKSWSANSASGRRKKSATADKPPRRQTGRNTPNTSSSNATRG